MKIFFTGLLSKVFKKLNVFVYESWNFISIKESSKLKSNKEQIFSNVSICYQFAHLILYKNIIIVLNIKQTIIES